MALDTRLGYHWLIGGMTGTGKTTFATALAERLRWLHPGTLLLYVDSKGGEFDHLASVPGVVFYRQQEPPLWPLPPANPVAVWSPEYDQIEAYHAFFERVRQTGLPCIIVVDELSSLGLSNGQSFPVGLARVLKQGRAKQITLMVLTQELAYIPRQVLRQTAHIVLFALDAADPDDFDTKRARSLAGQEPPQQRYELVYRNRLQPWQRYRYRDYKHFLGMSSRAGSSRRRAR